MTASSSASLVRRALRALLDGLFPLACLGCGKEGVFACETCLRLVPEPDAQVCPICKAPYQPNGATCERCRRETALDGLLVARPYRFRLVAELIHTLKYRSLEKAVLPLVDLLEESLAHHSLPLPDLLVPVPLHPRRLRYRGFNQAELIARELGKRLMPGLGIAIDSESLRRIRFTRPQREAESREERLRNLTGAFAVAPAVAGPLVGKYVWLIDDVATTGTTLNECTAALKTAGVKKVWGVVIAR